MDSHPHEPLVSIAVLSYNYEKYIGFAIDSVLGQTYKNFELIITDDASKDRSPEIIRSYVDPRIQVIFSNENVGMAASYNKAFERAQGKYFVSLDADDAFTPNHLQEQVDFLEAHRDVDILGTYICEIDENGTPIAADRQNYAPWFNQQLDLNDAKSWLLQNHLNHSSVMMRTSLHRKVGPFNPELRFAADLDLWMRCFVMKKGFSVLPSPSTLYRAHSKNFTNRDPLLNLSEMASIYGKYLVPFFESEKMREAQTTLFEGLCRLEAFEKAPHSQQDEFLALFWQAEPVNSSSLGITTATSFVKSMRREKALLEEKTALAERLIALDQKATEIINSQNSDIVRLNQHIRTIENVIDEQGRLLSLFLVRLVINLGSGIKKLLRKITP